MAGHWNNIPNDLNLRRRYPGLHNLSDDIYINGSTISPTFRYVGGDLTSTTWPGVVGSTLTLTGSGSNPTIIDGTPFYGHLDGAADFGGTGNKYFTAPNNTFADLDGEDMIIEVVFRWTGQFLGIIGKGQNTTPFWRILSWSSHRINFSIYDLTTSADTISSVDSVSDNEIVHFMAYLNRDENSTNGMFSFINGVETGTGGNPSSVGSVSNTRKLVVGHADQNASQNGEIYTAAAWIDTDMIPAGSAGKNAVAAIAKQRFFDLTAGTGSMYIYNTLE